MGKIGLKGVRNPDLYGDPRYTQLQQDAATNPEVAQFLKIANSGQSAPGTYDTEAYFTPRVDNQWKELGQSVYDPTYMIGNDASEIQENRAQKQPGIVQLFNGGVKELTTAGTTFLDNTLGFLYGLGTGVKNVYDLNQKADDTTFKENAYAFLQGMWDNDFNKAMTDFQDEMEKIAPNYYTKEELNSPWYTNILSANFIGDKVMKNMGFTQGAILAMAATEGLGLAKLVGGGASAITKFTLGNAGKLLGASKGTLATINQIARGTGQIAHHAVQTAIGASGEASIEAINAVKEGSKDAYNNLALRRQELINNLDPYSPDYQENLMAIDAATEQYKNEIDAKFRDAGNSVYLANMAILSVTNALEFPSLIKGGFKRAAKLTDFERRLGERTVGAQEWAQGILRGETASIVNTVDKGWKPILGKTALNSFSEAFEEGSQNLASNSNQYQAKAKLNKVASDSILGARINPEATEDLVDYTKAFSKALYDNFGSPESPGWEEFFLGGLTGGLGFIGMQKHAVKDEQGRQKYDPKTNKPLTSWKPRSISDLFQGGFWEAKQSLQDKYDENQLIVDAVNKRLSNPDFIKRTQHAIASRALSKEMDEALEQNDMFKFKNSEIGKLVQDVFFFREKGMLDEYKSIYQGFSNIDDKTLQQLYAATADPNGDTQLAQEDMEEVRKEYEGKAKRNLEKIKLIQDYYDYVDQEYREYDPLFKEELAYQYIRLDDTKRRIKELEAKNKTPNRVKSVALGLLDASELLLNDDNTPTTFRQDYENSIEGLTDSEKEDLRKLRRQEAQYQRWIDSARKNPQLVTNRIQRVYTESAIDYASKDVNAISEAIKNANSLAEIDRILANTNKEVKQDIINKVYQEGDDELRAKLKNHMTAVSSYNRTQERLKKAGQSTGEKLLKATESLLFKIYMDNDLDLAKTREVLQKIHDDLEEDSIATIVDEVFNSDYEKASIYDEFLGENQQEKDIFLDVLEGAIEDTSTAIQDGERWKAQQDLRVKVQKQVQEEDKKQQQEEEKEKKENQSFEDSIEKTTYVKQINNLKPRRKTYEDFGVDELENIIKDTLEETGEQNNPVAVQNILIAAQRIFAKDDLKQAVKDYRTKSEAKLKGTLLPFSLNTFLGKLEEKFRITPSKSKSSTPSKAASWREAFDELGLLGKNENVGFITNWADDSTDGSRITDLQATVVKKSVEHVLNSPKDDNLKQKLHDAITRQSNKTKAPVNTLTILYEAADAFYEGKLTKEDILGFLDYLLSYRKDSSSILTSADTQVQFFTDAFYKANKLDPANLSKEEQQEILDNIEKALGLVRNRKTIPEDLQPYGDVILANDSVSPEDLNEGNHEVVATEDNELNGASRSLFNVGNASKGIPNPLQNMEAIEANEDTLKLYFQTVQNARKVQWCIDNILKDIKTSESPIKIISLIGATYPDGSPNTMLYTAVKANDEAVKNLPNDKKWEVETNEGKYVIIGTLGYNGSSTEQSELWQNIRQSITEQIAKSGYTQGFWVSIDETHDFKVNNVGDGRPVQKHQQHSSTHSIVELITGADKGRNPHGLTLKTLKWQIIYTDGPKSVHMKRGDKVRGNAKLNEGKVYVLVPAADGSYYRHPVSPVTIDGINKDSKLFKQIDKLLEDIITKKKTKDVIKLKNKLVLESATEDRSFLDIYFNDDGIKVNMVPHGSTGTSETIILSQDTDKAIQQLKSIVYNDIRPFISVTLSHLENPNAIQELNEAGALQLKEPLSVFSYIGANYTVIPYKQTSNSKPGTRVRSTLSSDNTKKDEIWYQGQQIFRKGTGYERSNGEAITDALELEALEDISNIKAGQHTGQQLWKHKQKGRGKNKEWIQEPFEGEYFFIQKGSSTVVYHVDSRGNYKKLEGEEAKEALNTKKLNDEYRLKNPEKFNQEDIETQEEGETLVDLDAGTNGGIKLKSSYPNTISVADITTIDKSTLQPNQVYISIHTDKQGYTKIQVNKTGITKNGKVIFSPGKTNGALSSLSAKDLLSEESYQDLFEENNRGFQEKGIKISEVRISPNGYAAATILIPTVVGDYYTTNVTCKVDPLQYISADQLSDREKEVLGNSNQGVEESQKTVKISLPSIGPTGEREVEALTIKKSDIKEGDTIGYSGPESSAVIDYGQITTVSGNDVVIQTLSGEYILPENREYFKILHPEQIVKGGNNGGAANSTNIEQRKQDAIKKATYDLKQKLDVGIGDSISSNDKEFTIMTIDFDENAPQKDQYSYSDIPGTVIAIVQDTEGNNFQVDIDNIIQHYKKSNKVPQKAIKGLDNSGNSSTFVTKLFDSLQDTNDIEDMLYEKAASIAESKGIDFDDECSIPQLVEWFKNNIGFDLNSIPNTADIDTVKEIIDKCK